MVDRIEGTSHHPLGHIGPGGSEGPMGSTPAKGKEEGTKALAKYLGEKAWKEIHAQGLVTPGTIKEYFKSQKLEETDALKKTLSGISDDVPLNGEQQKKAKEEIGIGLSNKFLGMVVMDMMRDLQTQEQQLKQIEQENKNLAQQ